MTQCGHPFHRSPGGLIACPRCAMPVSEAVEQLRLNGAATPVQSRQVNPPQPTTRVQIKMFEGDGMDSAAESVVAEANEWLNKISLDERVQVMDVQTHCYEPHGLRVIIGYAVRG